MNLARRVPRLSFFKFGPFAIIALFLFSNITGLLFSRAFAPNIQAKTIASTQFDKDGIPFDMPSSGDHELDLLILHAGECYGVDPRLIHAVIWQESKYKNDAKSHAGAQGLMQMMPATARRFGCSDAYDSASNIDAGTQYLAWLLKRFDGDVSLALAGYNAGEGSVDKFGGIPPFNETQNYVRIITGRYGKTYHPVLTPEDARIEFHMVPTEVAQLQ